MDALHAELLECLAGGITAREMGMSEVNIETYSMLAKLAMETNMFANRGNCVCNKKLMSSVLVAYCPRECTRVAL